MSARKRKHAIALRMYLRIYGSISWKEWEALEAALPGNAS
jgi:hypothetical protein